jgi:hypothetical protein
MFGSRIGKGIISSFEASTDRNGDANMARVLPATAQSMPTRPLVISWHLRGKMGNLKINDVVWFALADDLSGIILERADGEWSGTIPGDVTITGDQKTEGKTETTDVKTNSVSSLNSHVHSNGHEGADTGAPTG